MPEPELPVTVVGGYLGAGKTTLVNAVLRGSHGRKVAVLVNDFGEIDVDAALIESHDGTTIALSNGCACCSIGDDLAEAFHRVASWEPRYDHVIVEASGVADPARLAAWATIPGLRLDGVVVLADAETIRTRARDRYVGETVLRQLRGADLIVLTKADLVATSALEEVRAWVSSLLPDVPAIVVPADRAVELLLGLDARERDGAAEPDAHVDLHRAVVVELPEAVDPSALAAAFAPPVRGLVRAKGFVRTPDGWVLLQTVGSRTVVVPSDPPAGARSAIVAIGVGDGFDAGELGRRLAAAAEGV